jgi:hypothetical protein
MLLCLTIFIGGSFKFNLVRNSSIGSSRIISAREYPIDMKFWPIKSFHGRQGVILGVDVDAVINFFVCFYYLITLNKKNFFTMSATVLFAIFLLELLQNHSLSGW